MKTVTIVTGGILMLTGVWCLANPGATFLSLAFIIGIVMLIVGLNGFFAYGELKKQGEPVSYLLPEAIVSVILGAIVLSNQLVSDAAIPIFFGMWIMYSGIMRVLIAVSKKRSGDEKGWVIILIPGLLSIAAGVYSFYNPIAAGIAIVIMIGVFFLIQGLNTMSTGLQMQGKKKING